MQSKDLKSAYKYLIPSVLFFAAGPLLSLLVLQGEDRGFFLLYAAAFFLFALAARPLMHLLFPKSPDGGWLYGKLSGLLIVSLTVWWAAYAGLPIFSRGGIFAVFVLWALVLYALSYARGKKKQRRGDFSFKRLSLCLAESGLFFLLFLFWSFVRSLKPEIFGLEKFMDYGFMMSMWRSPVLPAKDMWLAGHAINYYYFGQFLYTVPAKLLNIPPAYAYNLSIAASFALSFTLAFALVRDLIWAYAKHENPKRRRLSAAGGGLLSAALLCLGGNSHAFFYAPGRPGNAVVRFLKRSGVETGELGNFFFSDSTRFIGYNPETADRTIHEFPYYSYLVADLHAHMINLSVVLLLLAVLFSLYRRLRHAPSRKKGEKASVKQRMLRRLLPPEVKLPAYIAAGLLLGICAMGNFWDFVIYLVVAFFVLLFAYGGRLREENLGSYPGFGIMLIEVFLQFMVFLKIQAPLPQLFFFLFVWIANTAASSYMPSAFTKTGRGLSGLFFLSHLTALSFNRAFEPMAKSLLPVSSHSTAYQLFILWFAQLAWALIFVICLFVFNRRKMQRFLLKSPLSKFLSLDTPSLFVFILIACAAGLILAPEIVYVKDIYEGSFSRANTMFKFTYQAFSLLALAGGFSLAWLLLRALPKKASHPAFASAAETSPEAENPEGRFTLPDHAAKEGGLRDLKIGALIPFILSLALVLIPFSYTREIKNWYGPLRLERRIGLEGTAFFGRQHYIDEHRHAHPLDNRLDIIRYFNREVKGQPVILESFGLSYTEYCSVSAYTGLPTVLGWQTHEWLWRTSAEEDNAYAHVVLPLQEAITEFYEGSAPETQAAFLRRHKVQYIVVGELERLRFGAIDEEGLRALGDEVFRQGNDYVIKVRG